MMQFIVLEDENGTEGERAKKSYYTRIAKQEGNTIKTFFFIIFIATTITLLTLFYNVTFVYAFTWCSQFTTQLPKGKDYTQKRVNQKQGQNQYKNNFNSNVTLHVMQLQSCDLMYFAKLHNTNALGTIIHVICSWCAYMYMVVKYTGMHFSTRKK